MAAIDEIENLQDAQQIREQILNPMIRILTQIPDAPEGAVLVKRGENLTFDILQVVGTELEIMGECGFNGFRVNLRQSLSISADGTAIRFDDNIEGESALPAGTTLNPDGTTGDDYVYRRVRGDEVTLQPDFSQIQSPLGTLTAVFPITTTRNVKQQSFYMDEAVTGVRYVIRDAETQSVTDGAILWDSDTEYPNGLSFAAGQFTDIILERTVTFIQGRFAYVEVTQKPTGTGNISLRGLNTTIGGITQFFPALKEVPITESRDFIQTVERRTVEINGSINITSNNINVYRNKIVNAIITSGSVFDISQLGLYGIGEIVEIRNDDASSSFIDFRQLGGVVNGESRLQPGESAAWQQVAWGIWHNLNNVSVDVLSMSNLVKNVQNLNNAIRVTRNDDSTFDVTTSPFTRVTRNLGQGAGSGTISLTNLTANWMHFHNDVLNTSATNITSGLNNDSVFSLDMSDVRGDVTLDINQPHTYFTDNTQTKTLKAGHIMFGFAHATQPSQPISDSNRLYINEWQVSADGAMSPEHSNTVFLNPTQGFDAAHTDGHSRQRPFHLIGDAMAKAATFTGSDHKQIIVDEETTIAELNNNAVGGGNVPNLAVIAEAATFNNVTSISHSLKLHARRVDIRNTSQKLRISQNNDIQVDVISADALASAEILFDTTVSISHFKLKAGTVTNDVDLNLSNLNAMAAGSSCRIEIDRYEGNITTALNTLPDVAIYLYGWIGNTQIESSPNGTVYSKTLDNTGALVTTAHNSPS